MPQPRLPQQPRLGASARPERTPRKALSQDAVVDAALRIVDAEGLSAMGMRRVALELDTGAASLYAHVESKDRLIELVIDRVIGEMPEQPEPDPEHWEEQVKQFLRDMRATLARHKDLAGETLARIPMGENALRWTDSLIGFLQAGGLPDQNVAYACDLLALYAGATAYEDGLYELRDVNEEDFHAYVDEMREFYASLPPERFGRIVALAGPLTAGGMDDGEDVRFEFGLDVLVRGLQARSEVRSD